MPDYMTSLRPLFCLIYFGKEDDVVMTIFLGTLGASGIVGIDIFHPPSLDLYEVFHQFKPFSDILERFIKDSGQKTA